MRVQVNAEELHIVNGPGATRLLEIAVILMDDIRFPDVECAFTPNTKVKFSVKLNGQTTKLYVKITSLSRKLSMNSSLYYYFEGITSRGTAVYGYYSLDGKTGDVHEAD